MSIILEVFSPADGVAIIRAKQCLRLFRPPYKQSYAIELPESAVEDAVLNYDFHASGKPFESWAKVIAFLNQQLVEYREQNGRSIAESLSSIEILEVAPLDVLQGFLNKVENELIPQGRLEYAENFLLALLESGASQKHPQLTIQGAKLLKQIRQTENCKNNPPKMLTNKYTPFNSLARKNSIQKANWTADYIKQRHGFFDFSAHAN